MLVIASTTLVITNFLKAVIFVSLLNQILPHSSKALVQKILKDYRARGYSEMACASLSVQLLALHYTRKSIQELRQLLN